MRKHADARRRALWVAAMVAACALWAWSGYHRGLAAGLAEARAEAVSAAVGEGHAERVVLADGSPAWRWLPSCAEREAYRRDVEAARRVTIPVPAAASGPRRETVRGPSGRPVVLVSWPDGGRP